MKKIVFITGANRGLGAAIATEFAALDYKVVISGRNFAACQKKAAEIGSGVVAVQCDITNKESVAKARDFVAGKYKKIDVLVNNAGIILPIEKFCDADPEEWENLINTNITGQMRITHAFYSLLKKAAHARIINISSGSALRPLENWSAYCTSKAGFAMLSRCLDLEFSQVNIRSFAFAPGMIDTNMQAIIRKSNTPNKNMFEKKNLTNTKPAARLATWLASGEADDLAGKDLNIRDNEIIQRASL